MFNKMSLYRVKKGLVYLRYFGPKEFLIRFKRKDPVFIRLIMKNGIRITGGQKKNWKDKDRKRFRMHL